MPSQGLHVAKREHTEEDDGGGEEQGEEAVDTGHAGENESEQSIQAEM